MAKKIKCVGENLEDFIKYGDQIPYYKYFHGGPGSTPDRKTKKYYIQGKKFSEIFDKGEDFLDSLLVHTKNCEKCSEEINKLKDKYSKLEKKEINKLDNQVRDNLRGFGLLG